MPRLLWRLVRLWNSSRYSKIALGTALGHVHDDLVRIVHPAQARAGATWLLARLAVAAMALSLGHGRLGKPIRGRRLGGVARVLAQLALQLGNPSLQPGDHPAQLNDDRCLGSKGSRQVRFGGRDRGLRQLERHARLPMGLRDSYRTHPSKSTSPQPTRFEDPRVRLFCRDWVG